MRHPLKEWRIEAYVYTSPKGLEGRSWVYWKDDYGYPSLKGVSDIMTIEKGVKRMSALNEYLNHALLLRLHNERTDESIMADIL